MECADSNVMRVKGIRSNTHHLLNVEASKEGRSKEYYGNYVLHGYVFISQSNSNHTMLQQCCNCHVKAADHIKRSCSLGLVNS